MQHVVHGCGVKRCGEAVWAASPCFPVRGPRILLQNRQNPGKWPRFSTLHQVFKPEIWAISLIVACGGTDFVGRDGCFQLRRPTQGIWSYSSQFIYLLAIVARSLSKCAVCNVLLNSLICPKCSYAKLTYFIYLTLTELWKIVCCMSVTITQALLVCVLR